MALRSYWNLVLKNRNCVYTSVDLCHVTSLGLTHHYGLWVTVRVIIRVIIVWCFISHDFDDCRNSDRTRPTLTPSRAKVRVQTSVVWNSFYSNYTVPSAVLIASCKTYSCTIEKHAAKSSEKSEARGGLTISCGGRAGMGLRQHAWRLARVPVSPAGPYMYLDFLQGPTLVYLEFRFCAAPPPSLVVASTSS